MRDYVFVTNQDDWSGVYADGQLLEQGHLNQGFRDGLRMGLKEGGQELKEVVPDPDWLERVGRLPDALSEVVPTVHVPEGLAAVGPLSRPSSLAEGQNTESGGSKAL